MSVGVHKGVIVSPGSTGDQAITGVGFVPKFVLFWYTQATTDGAVTGAAPMSIGAGTRDGGATQQWYLGSFEDDATAASSTGAIQNTTAALKGVLNSNPAIDFALTLVTFDSDGFTVNWSDLPAVSSTVIHYWALGGSDVSAARAGVFTTTAAVATQDVTVNTGFGQPDLLLFVPTANTVLADGTSTNCGMMSLGAAISSTERRCCVYRHPYNKATMDVSSWHGNRAVLGANTVGNVTTAADSEADLSTKASWPTDGFQLSYTDQAASAQQVFYVAIKGTFTATISNGTVPTATAPQTQNLAIASGTPVGALLWGAPIAAASGVTLTATGLGGFFIGGTDGTNEGVAGFTTQDAALDENVGRFHSTGKAIQEMVFDTTVTNPPVLQAEADSSISGSNIVLTWNDTDTVGRDFSYLLIGSASSSATVTAPAVTGVGDIPSPTAAGHTDATVTAPIAVGLGDVPNPIPAIGLAVDNLNSYADGVLPAPWQPWTGSKPDVVSGKAYSNSGLKDATTPSVIESADEFCEIILEGSLDPTGASGQDFGVGVRLTTQGPSADGYSFEITGLLYPQLSKGSGFAFLTEGANLGGLSIDGLRIIVTGGTTTTIKGYARISGVWTEVVSYDDSSSPFTARGYAGFWVAHPSSNSLGVDQVTWGDSNAFADATIVSPAIDGIGDVPNPVASADAVVVSPILDGTGTLPPTNSIISAEVGTGPLIGTGGLLAPTASGTGAGTVVAPALDGAGDVATPGVSADSAVSAQPVDGVGDLPDPVASGTSGSTVSPGPLDGVGDLPDPGTAGGSGVDAGLLDGAGDVPTPSQTASANVGVGPAHGVGAMLRPILTASGAVLPRIDLPTRVIMDPMITTVIVLNPTTTMVVDPAITTHVLSDPAPTAIIDPQPDSVVLDGQQSGILIDA